MGEYASEDWYHNHVTEMLETHGDFPPPWIFTENSHPYSIGWYMGATCAEETRQFGAPKKSK